MLPKAPRAPLMRRTVAFPKSSHTYGTEPCNNGQLAVADRGLAEPLYPSKHHFYEAHMNKDIQELSIEDIALVNGGALEIDPPTTDTGVYPEIENEPPFL